MLEGLNEAIRRRTRVVRIFPKEQSCLRLVRAFAVETHENWIEALKGSPYIPPRIGVVVESYFGHP